MTLCGTGDQNAGGVNGPPSGAYIFRPDGLVVPSDQLQLHVAKGPVLTELHVVFLDYTSAVIRSAPCSLPYSYHLLSKQY